MGNRQWWREWEGKREKDTSPLDWSTSSHSGRREVTRNWREKPAVFSLPWGQYDTGGGTREVLIINMPRCSITQTDIFLRKRKHNNCGTIATNQAVLGIEGQMSMLLTRHLDLKGFISWFLFISLYAFLSSPLALPDLMASITTPAD